MTAKAPAPAPEEGGAYIVDKNGVMRRDSHTPQTRETDPLVPAASADEPKEPTP